MKQIPLSNTKNVALVDDDDYDLVSVFSWRVNNCGYAITEIHIKQARKTVIMHRLILRISNPKITVDHINGNKLDNRKSVNLRIANKSQNAANGQKHKDNMSGFTGVWFVKRGHRSKRWTSMITVRGKRLSLGYFFSAEEAARAYDKAAIMHFGDFALLNFPKE